MLTFFGFMHGESVGIAVTPTVAIAYVIVAVFLFGLSRAPASSLDKHSAARSHTGRRTGGVSHSLTPQMRSPLQTRRGDLQKLLNRCESACRCVAQRSPAQLVARRDGLLQKAHELLCFLFSQAAQHDPLSRLDRRRDAA